MPGDAFEVSAFGVFAKNLMLLRGVGLLSTAVNIGANGTYAPDLNVAVEHNITCAGNITISNPVDFAGPPISGFSHFLYLHIRNASGGVITITFGPKIHVAAGFTPAANGSGNILLLHHDEIQDVWYSSSSQTVVT